MQKSKLPQSVRQAADDLLQAIAESQVYQSYMQAKDTALQKPENAALLRRYREVQMELSSLSEGQEPDEAMRRDFEKLNMLVFDDEQLSAYVLAGMKLEMMLGQVVEEVLNVTEDGTLNREE